MQGGYTIRTIGFEGVCCAGKSACIKQIRDLLPVYFIPEYNDYKHKVSDPPQSSEKLIWKAMYIFSNIEKKRFEKWSEIKNLMGDEIVLVDRSFITILAVQYAVILHKTSSGMMDKLEEYWLGLPHVIIPDKIVILDVSSNQQLKRAKNSKVGYLPIFLEESFNSRFVAYIRDFCKKINIENIYVDTTSLSLDQVRGIVLENTSLS